MKVGILGSGEVAKALAKGFVGTGHSVMLGSRNPKHEALLEWARTAGTSVSTGTFADTAKFGELLILATLGSAREAVVKLAGASNFDHKVVIDATNPLAFEPNAPPRLFVGHTSSAGELLQAELPKAKVVKAFNIVGNSLMFQPKLPGGPPDMFIAGNDSSAKATVAKIMESFGWPVPVDIGGIEGSRELESLCLLWVKSAFALQNFQIAFKLLRAPAKS
jgi:predicted dinucleotide-binding enzyme